ncbi:rCG22295 [Rattus norvegicus]|uniref:RCG22295 n=1 Tax=Rattus norvegicus TaxID=10116 RepID=A6IPD3_RAT|nr:rCG22295 [Rattus norvegicus]
MLILTANHWAEVRDPCGRARGRIEGAEEDAKPIGRTTVLTNLGP